MKEIKRILFSILLCLCLVTVGFVSISNAESIKNISSTNISSIKAYNKFLKNNKYVYGLDKYYKMNYFTTLDLDKNGVKELIMIDKTQKEITVYTYTNGKVKYCGNMYDRSSLYIDKNKRLARTFNNSGVKMNYYLTLNSKNKLYLVSFTYDKIEKRYYKETGLIESSKNYHRTKISKKTAAKEIKKTAFSKNINKHLNNSYNRNKYLK